MKFKSFAPLALICLATSWAHGQTSTRIATIDINKVFRDIAEIKDFRQDLDDERMRLTGMEKERRDELTKLQNERDSLKVDTAQWEDLNNKLMDNIAEFQLWVQSTKVKAERNQKRRVKAIFLGVESAVNEIAKRDGYDLVVSDQRPELPDNLDTINLEELQRRIGSRSVFYANPKNDISAAVIAIVDTKYKAAGGGGRARTTTPEKAPAPAPAPKTPAPAPAPAPKK